MEAKGAFQWIPPHTSFHRWVHCWLPCSQKQDANLLTCTSHAIWRQQRGRNNVTVGLSLKCAGVYRNFSFQLKGYHCVSNNQVLTCGQTHTWCQKSPQSVFLWLVMNLIQLEKPSEQFQLDNYCGVCVFSPLHAEERRMWDVERDGLNQKNGENEAEKQSVPNTNMLM